MATFGFIGTGNMGGALARAARKRLPGEEILLANRNPDKAKSLSEELQCNTGSNEDAARFAAVLAQSGTSEIILAHLSRENNTPAMAQTAVERALSAAGVSPLLSVAPRDCLGPAHTVSRRSVCRR
mgnify:CR=1 FL=1